MPTKLDKKKIRRSFEKSAASYDEAAVVQHRMIDELVERLGVLKINPQRILDAGCGTGYALAGLMQCFPEAEYVLIDFATSMLNQAKQLPESPVTLLCGDVESLPLAAHSVDMVFCSALLEWCDPELALTEFLRVLKPGGLLTFATFGPDTLTELRDTWREVDDGLHVHDFPDMHNLGDLLVRFQFGTPVMDVDYLTVTHRSFPGVLKDLKALGTVNAAVGRNPGLTGKGTFRQLQEASEQCRNSEGLFVSTYEIVYGHAWAPAQTKLKNSDDVAVPVSELRTRRKFQ